jgi:CrcB protein
VSGLLAEASNLHLLAVAVGAGVGAVCRAAVDRGIVARVGVLRLPYATLLVNVLGSFLLGVVLAWAAGATAVDADTVDTWRLTLGTGFCGGLTTFSTYSVESYLMIREGRPRACLVYAALTIGLAMAALVAGDALGAALA